MAENEYVKLGEDALVNLLEIVGDKDGWTKCQNVNNIFISSKKSSYSPGNMFKADFEIEAPIDKVLHIWSPKPKGCRGDWDKGLSSCDGFQRINDETMLVRTTTPSAAMGLISPREFLDVVLQREYPDRNMTVIACQSCQHPDYEVTTEFVRAKNYPCGGIFTAITGTPMKIGVCYLAHVDIGGNIPLSLTEAALPTSIHSTIKQVTSLAENDDGPDQGSAI